jgi:tetratricopeptide (TPR) repeat protein
MESPAVNVSSKRRIRRRWRVPPAIMHDSEALENAAVLDEHGRDTGLVLWQSLRDVTIWAVSRPSEREGLFASGAEHHRIARIITSGLDPELEQPLSMITSMVGRPEKVMAERVSIACRHVSQWAEQRGKLATALAFAQAAAIACPGNAAAAYKVGQMARRRAEYVRAETWFRRAIALGRQQGDWTSYALGFSGLGNLYVQRGSFPRARSYHTRALRAAKRHCLRSIQGDAYHDMHVIATASGQEEQALEYARGAFACYGPGHVKLPALAHDVAYFWLTQGYFGSALTVFQALMPLLENSSYGIYVLPNVARAAGGSGNRRTYEAAWERFRDWAQAGAAMDGYAEGLLEFARGATSLKDWEHAEQTARAAVEAARARGEARIELAAEALLESIRSDCRAEAVANVKLPAELEATEVFAEELVRSLEHCAVLS